MASLLGFGHLFVAAFIVLSGYCLMLPVAATEGLELRGGVWEFLKRRAWRILPPYYASLAISLIIILLAPSMRHSSGMHSDLALPAFTPDVILSHLFMVHNLSPKWELKINGVYWSIGLEWQIYFVFALVLLPICRRIGIVPSVIASIGLGLIPWYKSAFYITLFGLGMAAAMYTERRGNGGPKRLIAIGGAVLAIIATGLRVLTSDFGFGVFVAFFLMYGTLSLRAVSSNAPLPLRLLSSKAFVNLGVFSYSLYLTHEPLIALLHIGLRYLHLTENREFLVLLILTPLVALPVAYMFHVIFEKPFQTAMKPKIG